MNRTNLPTSSALVPFGLGSIVTSSCRWTTIEEWGIYQNEWFARWRPQCTSNFFAVPKKITRNPKMPGPSIGRWQLSSMDAPVAPLAWAELQCFKGAFKKAFLIISLPELPGAQRDFVENAIHILIGAIDIWGGLDVVDVLFVEHVWQEALSLPASSPHSVRSFDLNQMENNSDTAFKLPEFAIQQIDLFQWREHPIVQSLRADLQSIRSRRGLADKKAEKALRASNPCPPPSRRGIVQRLFSSWRRRS